MGQKHLRKYIIYTQITTILPKLRHFCLISSLKQEWRTEYSVQNRFVISLPHSTVLLFLRKCFWDFFIFLPKKIWREHHSFQIIHHKKTDLTHSEQGTYIYWCHHCKFWDVNSCLQNYRPLLLRGITESREKLTLLFISFLLLGAFNPPVNHLFSLPAVIHPFIIDLHYLQLSISFPRNTLTTIFLAEFICGIW